MPLETPQPPVEVNQSLREGLQRLPARNKHAFATAMGGGAVPTISNPHHVFTMTPQQIASGVSLDAAKPTAWRYLLSQPTQDLAGGSAGGSAVATAEVADQEGGPRFSNMQHGWIANATQRAIAVAQKLPEVTTGSFELRMLRLPPLYLDAIWLKNNAAGNDLVIPIASLSKQLVPYQPYSADDFLARIRDLAAQKLGFDNAPESSSP